MDLGDVLAAEAPAPGDQLRKLAGSRLGIEAGGGVARVPQPASGREDPEMTGAERLRARHVAVDVLAVVAAIAVRVRRRRQPLRQRSRELADKPVQTLAATLPVRAV